MLLQAFTLNSSLGTLLDLPFFVVAWAHIALAPYTKVEESFNLHATHDVLAYGVTSAALPFYDHFIFPGVVPRTFIGSVALAAASYLPLRISTALGIINSKLGVQILVRVVLATLNAFGLGQIRWAVQRRYGVGTAALFMILTCTQFHLPFWIGRTLPNMFALLPVNLATSLLVFTGTTPITVMRHYRIILCLIGAMAIIFRSELALLALPTLVMVIYQRAAPISFLVPFGACFAVGSIVSTILVDSYFWNQWSPPMWPELAGILFNVYEGKSSEWGTSPYHAYLSLHLPKLLLASLPLGIVACVPSRLVARIFAPRVKDTSTPSPNWHTDGVNTQSVQWLLAPPLAFVLLISGLAHKEWRFVVYVVPVVNVAAAVGAKRLISLPTGSLRIAARFIVIGLILGNILITTLLTIISRANYPGGAAITLLNTQHYRHSGARVHIDNLAAQTGASLFTQEHASPFFFARPNSSSTREWTYSKDPAPKSFDTFTHLVTEHPEEYSTKKWGVVDSVEALRGIDPRRGWNALITKPTLFILQNKDLIHD